MLTLVVGSIILNPRASEWFLGEIATKKQVSFRVADGMGALCVSSSICEYTGVGVLPMSVPSLKSIVPAGNSPYISPT